MAPIYIYKLFHYVDVIAPVYGNIICLTKLITKCNFSVNAYNTVADLVFQNCVIKAIQSLLIDRENM